MQAKRWIGVLAVLGVLAHAAAAAHHVASFAGATLQYIVLRADLAQLCHGGAGRAAVPASELPFVPRPTDGQGDCNLCCTLGTAVAVLAAARATLFVPAPAAPAGPTPEYRAPRSTHAACPPARGPPALA